jgi:membrane protein required for beta-lactamase induction
VGPLSYKVLILINVLLMVGVVGLLFALEMAILGSFGLWTGQALQTLIFGTTKLDTGVQLFKSYKMSPS